MPLNALLAGSRLRAATCLATAAVFLLFASASYAQTNGGGSTSTSVIGVPIQPVGGISIDAQGILSNPQTDAMGRLRELRIKALSSVPGELAEPSTLRKVSLKQLEAAIGSLLANGEPIPDEMQLLAGLQSVKYVFVYPEQNDIVLAGPAEGWTVDEHGSVVGSQSGLPALHLDDLLIAMRTIDGEVRAGVASGIACSIDPTAEGLKRLNALYANQRRFTPQLIPAVEQSLGPQTITVRGVPETSHFARVMVAADYRMKRLAMRFEPIPVRGLTSYLDMMSGRGPAGQQAMPRWWLAPDYDPLMKDPDGLAWELRGSRVRCMAEEDAFSADGVRQISRQATGTVQKWADLMTEHYDELAAQMPIFNQLRQCMDLAVVAALVYKENLASRAGCDMELLLNGHELGVAEFPAPKQVASQASVLKKGSNWIISTSGGVQVDAWSIVSKVDTDESLAEERRTAAATNDHWWWD